MRALLRYLRDEGLRATVNKVFSKLFRKKSVTVFLRCESFPERAALTEGIKYVPLTAENQHCFDSIKFFEHMRAEDYVDNGNREILLIYKDEECVGYAAAEYEQLRDIHGLGTFRLNEGEAWLGPLYIRRAYRGQGINADACRFLLSGMPVRGIRRAYTAINSENSSSLRSIAKVGFVQVGQVSIAGEKMQLDDPEQILSERFAE